MKFPEMIERVYKRLLMESNDVGLAAAVARGQDRSPSRVAVLYDPVEMEQILMDINAPVWKLKLQDVTTAVRGYIAVADPAFNPCADAWEVKAAWGPGIGSIVYAVGHALSPTGIIMPDRREVSPAARSGWQKQAEKNRKFTFLDDAVAHETGKPHSHHTEDPEDDCTTHGLDILDRAYHPQGGEKELLKRMQARHSKLTDGMDEDDVDHLFRCMLRAADDQFIDSLPPDT